MSTEDVFVWVQNDYFQDDLFPPTKVLWEPTMTSSKWFGGANVPAKRLDLKPSDMETRKILGYKFFLDVNWKRLFLLCFVDSIEFEGSVDDAVSYDGSAHRRADCIFNQRRRWILIRRQRAQRA